MGRDKAELKLGDRTLIELQTGKLRSLGIPDIMLSGYRKEVPGTRCIPDRIPHRGPVSGLHACLQAAKHSACLVIGVDVPLIPAETLQELIEEHEEGITALSDSERTEPLIAVYDCRLWQEAERILKSERSALRKLFDCAPVKTVRYTGDERLLLNCNTPEDFERIKSLWNT